RVTGYSKGKGGSMHMFARDKRFYGGHGIVGACVPLGTGIAFAHKYRDDGGVCVTYLGDGERASASTELYRRGEAYGIPGEPVDGMDVLAVRAAAEEAVGHARTHGPTILEALTYRYRGHSMSDPAKYRSRQEVQEVRTERDPIDRLRKTMLDRAVADEDALKAIDKEIRAIVNEAASFAQDSPEPGPDELYKDVYVDV
ncbi:MAG: pdhA, partial [Geminicoccaceae bacterium]|nr:pdhA [Geminicoccaceae bacterium]